MLSNSQEQSFSETIVADKTQEKLSSRKKVEETYKKDKLVLLVEDDKNNQLLLLSLQYFAWIFH